MVSQGTVLGAAAAKLWDWCGKWLQCISVLFCVRHGMPVLVVDPVVKP